MMIDWQRVRKPSCWCSDLMGALKYRIFEKKTKNYYSTQKSNMIFERKIDTKSRFTRNNAKKTRSIKSLHVVCCNWFWMERESWKMTEKWRFRSRWTMLNEWSRSCSFENEQRTKRAWDNRMGRGKRSREEGNSMDN